MLTVKITLETGLKLAELFVSCGFCHEYTYTWREPLTVEMQLSDMIEGLQEEKKGTIFILHDDGRFSWRTIGDSYSFNEIDSTANSGEFSSEQVTIIKEFLLANSEPVVLKGMDRLYGIIS